MKKQDRELIGSLYSSNESLCLQMGLIKDKQSEPKPIPDK